MRETTDQTEGVDAIDALSLADLRQRGTAKWSYYGDGMLAAWIAEMDFPLAPAVRVALQEAVSRGTTGYAPSPADSGLPAACAAWLDRRFGVAVEPRQIGILPDVLRGMSLAIEQFSRANSPVVVLTPAYPPFFETVRLARRQIMDVPMLTSVGRPTMDLTAIESALRAGAGTVLLCNPHNPLGRAFRREELAALSTLVEEHGARVIADEVHAPLVYPGAEHVSYSTVSEAAASHSVTLVSASKGWNLPGLKCAQIVLTNRAEAEQWERLSYLQTYGASVLGILANRVAFEQGEPWLHEVVAYLEGNRRLLGQLLADLMPRVNYTVPEATYLGWLDCRTLGLDDPAAFFLEKARVVVSDGAPFGEPGRGWVRLNFATPRPILTMIVEAMATALHDATA